MKIKSKLFWDMQAELDDLRQHQRDHDGDVKSWKLQAQEWRTKFEQLQTGGIDGKLEREKAFERGRQIGVQQAQGEFVANMDRLRSAPDPTR
jgi:hypothetical protein